MGTYFRWLLLLGLILHLEGSRAQEAAIQWLGFEQLEDSLETQPRKVLIAFYAEWCAYCRKMDRVAFRDPDVVRTLNSEFYAVRMDVESTDTIVFDGRAYTNPEAGKSRRPVHEIPRLLASREGVPFSLPAIIVLGEDFRVRDRFFEYLSAKKMRELLDGYSQDPGN